MKKFKQHAIQVSLLIFVLAISFYACNKDDDKDETPPGKVTEIKAIPGDGKVVLTWIDPTDEDLAQIEISITPGGFLPENIAAGTDTLTITNLTNGTEYTISLVAIDEAGNKSEAESVITTPNTPFRVIDPELASANSQDFRIEQGTNKVVVEVELNRAVDPSTVVAGETIYILKGTTVVSGSVSFSNGNKNIIFTTTETPQDWCTFTPDCFFKFVLVGNDSGDGVVKDNGNMPLDGDDNGTNGGNYEINLTLLG